MPLFENPYIDPVSVEHHATRHAEGGEDELTPEMIGLTDLDVLPVELGGTGFTDDYVNEENRDKIRDFYRDTLNINFNPGTGGTVLPLAWGGTGFGANSSDPANVANIRAFFNNGFNKTLDVYQGGTPLSISMGGTGFSGLIPNSLNLPSIRDFFKQGIHFAFASIPFYDGLVLGTGIPVADGGTGCTSEEQLETLIGTKFLSGYDTNCIHAEKHKTGGSDAMTAADIGACADDDSRLTDARAPIAHALSHKTGGSDAMTAADIGAADAGHIHAGYLEASFDDSTNYLTIGTKTFDLSSLVVP